MADNQQNDTQQVIFCEMCTEEDRKPARKTCMKCEISMCVQHLQAHLTTPVLLQNHPLTEPMAVCGTTKCPQHGKLLEYYCLDDMICVCVSCAIEDQHRLHNLRTFSTAHKDLMETLKAEQVALQVKNDDENVSLEKWEKSEREKLSSCSVRLIEAVTNLRDVSLTSIQSSVSARMVAIKTSKSSMQAAQNEKDTFRFLQMYSQVHQDVEKAKAVDLRKGLEPGSDRDNLIQDIRQNGEKISNQADQLLEGLLTLVDPEKHNKLFFTPSDLIFEPTVLGSSMSLSKDNRKVFHSSWMGQCAATFLIRSTQSVPNYQRWQVRLSKDIDWIIGLYDKKLANNPTDGPVYALCCKANQLSSLTTEYEDSFDSPTKTEGFWLPTHAKTEAQKQHSVSSTLISQEGANEDEATPTTETVEVFWCFVSSSLSFYRRSRPYHREEILTIKMTFKNWNLTPFVRLGVENARNHSDWPQQQWMCQCKRIHKMQKHLNSQCSCGENIGGRYITEMVCKLC